MDNESMLAKLFGCLPELEPDYAELLKDWSVEERPGAINVMDALWCPFVERASEEELSRAFSFLEDLSRSDDSGAQFMVYEYGWAQLGGTPLLEKARPHMGRRTREIVDRYEAEWREAPGRQRPSWWSRLAGLCRRGPPAGTDREER